MPYIPEDAIAQQYRYADRLQNQNWAPSWAGVLAAGLGGFGGGLHRNSAQGALQGNQSLMAETLKKAGQAPDLQSATSALIDSEVPSLQQSGVEQRMKTLADDPNKEYRVRAGQWKQMGYTPETAGYKEYVLTGEIPKPVKADTNTIEYREQAAAERGWDGNDPNVRAWIMTGDLPSKDMLRMTPTEQKELWKSQDEIVQMDSQIGQLEKAVGLNPNIYSGYTASTRAALGSKLPDGMVPDFIADPKTSEDTAMWENIMNSEAVKALGETLKGASTDYEMKKFISLMADPSQPPSVRHNASRKVLDWAKKNRGVLARRVEAIDPNQRFGGVPTAGAEPEAPTAPVAPKAGDVIDGYRFKGGDPSDQKNWEKQ